MSTSSLSVASSASLILTRYVKRTGSDAISGEETVVGGGIDARASASKSVQSLSSETIEEQNSRSTNVERTRSLEVMHGVTRCWDKISAFAITRLAVLCVVVRVLGGDERSWDVVGVVYHLSDTTEAIESRLITHSGIEENLALQTGSSVLEHPTRTSQRLACEPPMGMPRQLVLREVRGTKYSAPSLEVIGLLFLLSCCKSLRMSSILILVQPVDQSEAVLTVFRQRTDMLSTSQTAFRCPAC